MSNRIAIIGLGYVGLPLLEAFGANDNNSVIGFDISEGRVLKVRQAIADIKKDYAVTSNITDIASANIYIVTVPTPIDKDKKPDISCLTNACKSLASVIKKGDFVVFESTVYPTMTETVCIPIIETLSGLKAGVEFYFGYSPERINVGDPEHTLNKTVKVVAGCNDIVTEKIAELYKTIEGLRIKKAVSIKVAEAAKLMENTQRDILIAFANEYSEFCRKIGIKIDDVIDAASSKWNFADVYPGLVGGHCIGVDPYYLLQKASKIGIQMPLVTSARMVNVKKVSQVALRIVERLHSLRISSAKYKILILGFAYKKNNNDVRNTKVADLIMELEKNNCSVQVYDPLVNSDTVKDMYGIHMVSMNEISENRYHAIIEAVPHDVFKNFQMEMKQPIKFMKIQDLL